MAWRYTAEIILLKLEHKMGAELSPGNIKALLREGRIAEALAGAQALYGRNASDAETRLVYVIALNASGQSDAALTLVESLIADEPAYAEAFANRALIHWKAGRLAQAISDADAALTIKPSLTQLHPVIAAASNDLGIMTQAKGDWLKAQALFERALELSPALQQAHNNLGIILEKLGKPDQAILSYERALELMPTDSEAMSNLGSALRSTGQISKAADWCRKAVALNPAFAEAHSNLGNALQDLLRFDEAIASYEEALRLKPDHRTAHSNMIFCLQYKPGVTAQQIYEATMKWGEIHAAPHYHKQKPHLNSRDPTKGETGEVLVEDRPREVADQSQVWCADLCMWIPAFPNQAHAFVLTY